MALAGAEILLLKGKSDVVVKKIAVTSEQITFGNHPLNTVRVHQEQVERLHCRIALNKANVVELTNLSKLCPVRVNGETVTKKVQLKDGDLFAVAGCQFRWSYDVTSSNKVSKKRGSTKHFTRKHSADDLSYAVAKPQTRKTKVLFEFSRHRRTIHSLQSVLDQHEATHGKKRLQTPAKPPAEMLQVASHEEYEKENTPVKNTVNTPKKNQQLNTSSVMILSYTPLQSEKERRHVGCKTPNVADKPVRLVQTPLVSTSMLGSPMNVSKGGDSMYLVDLTTPTSKSVSRSNASSAVSGAKGRLLGTINLVSPSPKSTTPVSIRGRNGSALLKSAIKNAHITKGSMCGTPNTPKLSARNKLLARSGCKSADRQSTHTRIVPGNSIKKDLMKKMTAEDPSKDPFANEDAPRNTDPSIDLTEDCIDNELPVAVDTLCSEQIVPPTLSDVPAFDIEAVIKKPNFTRQIRCSNFSDITPDASYTENNADIETNENQTQEHRENTIIASWSVESELKTVSDRPIVKTTERKSYTPFAHKPLLSERSKRATIGHFGNNVYQTLVVSPVSVTEFKPDSSQRILIEPVPANDNEGVCDEQALLESPNDDDAAFVDDYDEDELLKSDSESFQSSKKINAEFNVPASPHLRVSLRDTRKFIGSAFTSLNTSRPQLDLTAEIDESLIVNDDDDDEDIINQKYDLTHLGEGAGIVASKDEMTQCVQRRSSETSSIIDKSKEATLRAAERIDLESDDEIDNETSYSSMNVSSTNQDDELMDGITLIPPTPPNEGEHDSSYEDNMEPCRSLSEIEENICGDSINKIIDSSISSASLEIDRETSAGLTMVRNQSAIEIMKPVLISESANNTIEASFPEAIVEVDRESSVAQTMDQKHSEIEIVEFKPNSDSANENVDSNLTPAAVEVDRESLAGQKMDQSQSEIEVVESELAGQKMDQSQSEIEVVESELAGQKMDQSQSEIEVVESELISDSANKSNGASVTEPAVKVDRESLAGQKMDQSQSEIEVVESELISDSANKSIGANFIEPAVEIYQGSLAGQKMDQSQSEIEVVESELISDSANKSIGASFIEPAVEIDRESLAGQKMDQSQSEIEVVESELISDSANKSIGASFIEPAVEIDRESLAGQKMDQSQPEIEVVESELISDSANKSNGASVTEPAVEIDRGSLAGQKMDQSQSEIEVVESELAGQKMDQSQSGIEVVESELISDSANKSIGASFIEPAVEIDRESLAGQKMDQSQPEIEVVESELISDSANKSNGASVTEPAVKVDRESLAGQKMDQSQSEIEVVESELAGQKMDQSQSGIEVVESELISDSANKSIGASFIEPAVEIDRESLAGQKMEQSQSEIEVVESELISFSANKSIGASFIEPAVEIDRGSLAGQKMDQSQSEIEVVESELISDSANKNIGASFIEPAVEIDRGSLAGQKMDQSQSEIEVVESELAGQKMDQSQSGIEVVESELISDSANKSIGANFIEPAVEIDRESLAGQKMDQSQPEIEVVESELISDSANKSNGASVTEPAVKVDRESLAGQKMDQSQSEIEVVESELISDSANKSIGASFIEPAVEIDRGSLAGQKMDQSQSEIEVVESELAGQKMDQSQSEIEVVESELISDSANKSIGANFIELAVEIDRESLAGQKMDQSQSEIEVVESELISDSANKSIGANFIEPAVEIDRESLARQKMDQRQSEIEIVESKPNSDSTNENVDSSLMPAAVEVDQELSVAQMMDQTHSETEVVESEPNSNSCYETVDSRFAPGNVAVDLQSSALVVTAASSPSDKIINITKKRKLFSKTDPLTLIINTDSPPQRLLESKYPEYVIENRAVSGKQKNKKDDTFTLNSSPKKSPIQRRQLPSRAARNRIVTLSEEELAGKSPKVKYCKPKNNTLSDSSSNNDFMKLDEKRKIIFNDIVDIKEFNSPNIEGDIIKKTKTRRVKDLNENPQKDINPLTKEGHEEPAEFIQPLKDNAVTSTPRGSTKLDLNSTKTKICMPPESPAIRRTRRMGTVLVDSPVLLTPSSTSAELSVDTKELAVQDKILEESSQVLTPNSGKSNQTKTRSTRSRKQLTVPGVTKISEEFIYNVKEPNTNNVSSEKSANKAKEGIENDDKTQEDTQLHEELPKKKGRKGKQTPIRSAKLDLKESLEEEIEKTNIDMQNLKPESPKKVGRKRRAKDAGSTEVKDLEPEYLYEQRTSKQAKHYEKSEEPDLVHNSTTEKQSETNIPKKRGNKKKIPHEETVDTKEKQTTKEETNHTPAKEQHFESKPPAKKGRTLKRDTYKDEPAVTEKSRLAVAKSDRLSEGEPKEERTDKSNLEEELPRKRGRKKKIAENVSVELTIECPADAESKGENLKADTAVEDLPKKRGRKMKMVQDEPIETKKIQSAKQKTIDPIQEKAGDEIDQQDTKKRGKTSKKQVGPSPGKSSTEPNVMNAENGVRTRSRRAKQAV
ncbi:uncharacterized protein LOC118461493 isoform X34 [Anopheles albimanus]|uniref:uncharacterized protein LOC118461493 isoform X34 n=1 Tax=Anopheles albimanus TaxID=7167 RepID=UPI00163FC241|nr:uncharacterized protein LOC118461493 isoform X34 [Anopheles albimanus]